VAGLAVSLGPAQEQQTLNARYAHPSMSVCRSLV
jgi:hypothetical protein